MKFKNKRNGLQTRSRVKKFKINPCLLVLIFVLFSVLSEAKAAELFFEPQEINTTTNSIEKVEVFLNTSNGENINALEINMEYPVEFLKLNDWSNGNSIINLWIKEPENNNGIFSFQGIIPGGYSEKKGLLMVLYFEILKEGDIEIAIKNDSLVLLNDGEGTAAKTSFSSAKIISKFSEEEPPKFEFTEKIPPEPFTPLISRSNEIYEGKYFLVFSTQDKNSGIDYYEISEGDEPFKIAQSPYLLSNQKLDKDIRTRAVDKAGNIRLEIISAEKAEEKNEFKEILFFSALLFLIIILVIFTKYIYNKNRKTKNN